MKRIAFYVEGQTEAIFLNKLIIEIAGRRNIEIRLVQFTADPAFGGKMLQTTSNPDNPLYYALIYDSGKDAHVKSDILENYNRLVQQQGFSQVIGLLDLYPRPLSDLAYYQERLIQGSRGIGALPSLATIVIAVIEIETWFLAEYHHYKHIHPSITESTIEQNLGFIPRTTDMTQRPYPPSPAQELHQIYQLATASRGYNKRFTQVNRTVEALDYGYIYLELRYKIPALGQLIDLIDDFLS